MELDVQRAIQAADSQQGPQPAWPRPRGEGQWSESAMRVLNERYLRKENGQVVETPDEMCWRVARAIADAEARWSSPELADVYAQAFYDIMVDRKFMPNSPTLM